MRPGPQHPPSSVHAPFPSENYSNVKLATDPLFSYVIDAFQYSSISPPEAVDEGLVTDNRLQFLGK